MSLTNLLAGAAPRLTDAQVEAFQQTGWVLARGFFTSEQMSDVDRWTHEILARPEAPGEHMVYHEASLNAPDGKVVQRIENFCGYDLRFNGFVNGEVKQALGQLLGEPVVLFKEKINFKMPGGAGFEPHQDQQAGWSVYAPCFVTALVSIDAATPANGCLEMASGPRLTGLIGKEWAPLTPEEMAGLRFDPILTQPGDVIFFDSYAPHKSERNHTDSPRRILYLTFNRQADGDHRDRYFLEKRLNFPPDIERAPGKLYTYLV